MPKIDHHFLWCCRSAIETMRQAGINETLIACVVTEIRSAALTEQFRMTKELIRNNPPTHYPHGDMADAIASAHPR